MDGELQDAAAQRQPHYGQHMTLRVSAVEREDALNSTEHVAAFLTDLVARLGFTVLAGPLTTEVTEPAREAGVSGVIILHESHAAIHTYALARSAFVDVFGCRAFNGDVVKQVLGDHFGAFETSEEVVSDRGLEWSRHVEAELDRWTRDRAGSSAPPRQ